MNPARTVIDYLSDIIDAIEKAQQFTDGLSFQEFFQDDKSVYAVVRALEIVGEASKRIPSEMRDANPQIPWRLMTGMRNRLAHDYFGVSVEVVWTTAKEDLPPTKTLVAELLETTRKAEGS